LGHRRPSSHPRPRTNEVWTPCNRTLTRCETRVPWNFSPAFISLFFLPSTFFVWFCLLCSPWQRSPSGSPCTFAQESSLGVFFLVESVWCFLFPPLLLFRPFRFFFPPPEPAWFPVFQNRRFFSFGPLHLSDGSPFFFFGAFPLRAPPYSPSSPPKFILVGSSFSSGFAPLRTMDILAPPPPSHPHLTTFGCFFFHGAPLSSPHVPYADRLRAILLVRFLSLAPPPGPLFIVLYSLFFPVFHSCPADGVSLLLPLSITACSRDAPSSQ